MILVTGAAGRLGQAVCRKLLAKGNRVRGLVRESHEHPLPKGIEPFYGDITDAKSLDGSCDGAGTAIHLAASLDFMGGREKLFAINAKGTENIAREAAGAGVRKFVLASSISVYGKGIAGMRIDENSPTNPTTDYGKSKLAAEKAAFAFSGKMRVIALRIGVVYGPGFEEGYAQVFRMLQRGSMRVLGSGENVIPFVHSDDVADAIMLAAAGKNPKPGIEIYNIVQNEEMAQSQILSLAAEAIGAAPPGRKMDAGIAHFASGLMARLARAQGKIPKMQPEYVEILSSDRRISSARARPKLGWKARVKLQSGIKAMAAEFLRSGKG